MNNETVIRLAQEAGLPTTIGWLDSIMRFAAAVAGVERESCAKECENYTDNGGGNFADHEGHGYDIAEAIRTRGQK